MPTYTFKCDACKNIKDVDRPMREAGNSVTCECGLTMDRVYNNVNICPDYDDFVATTGKPFFNKQLMCNVTSVNDAIEKAKRKGMYVLDR